MDNNKMFMKVPQSVDELEGIVEEKKVADEQPKTVGKKEKKSVVLSEFVKSKIREVKKPEPFVPPADPEECIRLAVEKLGKEMQDTVNRINEAVQKKEEKDDSQLNRAFRGYTNDQIDEQLKNQSKALDESCISKLITMCQKDAEFSALVINPVKKYNKCRKLIWERVKAILIPGDQVACIDNDVVYEWAADYYREDAMKEAEEEYKAACEKAKNTAIQQEKRKKTEERKKKEEERKARKAKKEKQEKMQMSLFGPDSPETTPRSDPSPARKEEDLPITDDDSENIPGESSEIEDGPANNRIESMDGSPKEETSEKDHEDDFEDVAGNASEHSSEGDEDESEDPEESQAADDHLEGFEEPEQPEPEKKPKNTTVTINADDEDEQMSILSWLEGN